MSRINKRERELSSRLRWLRQREDALVGNKEELSKLRSEIQVVTNELRDIRRRRSRFIYDVSDYH